MKMIRKNIFSLLIIGGISLLIGCSEDYLTLSDPNNITKGSFYSEPEDAVLATNAAYSSLQSFGLYAHYWPYFADFRSDEAFATSNATNPGAYTLADLASYNTLSTNEEARRIWRDNYRGIYRANEVLYEVGNKMKDIVEPDIYSRSLGEAHFLRGLYHFHLLKAYGERIVVADENPADRDDFFRSVAAPGEAWELIISDFKKAKELLPPKSSSLVSGENQGRATKGAAAGMLGKAYLFMTSKTYNSTLSDPMEYYRLAADEFEAIVNGEYGDYQLVDYFRANHDNIHENNAESLFEVQFEFIGDEGEIWEEHDPRTTQEGSLRSKGSGMHDGVAVRWYNNAPTQSAYDEFERAESDPDSVIDPRCYMTMWCPGGALFVDGEDTLAYDDINWIKGDFGWRKYEYDFDPNIVYGKQTTNDHNARILRLADVYLMYAEALIELGQEDEAANWINKVRERATRPVDEGELNEHLPYNIHNPQTNGMIEPLPTVEELIAAAPVINGVTVNNMRDALRHERRVELAGEQHRWFDIVRWDIGEDVIQDDTFEKPGSYFLPIPQDEVDNNPNLNQ
jgi:hypothetical protein